MLTAATAISRLENGSTSVFKPGATAEQKLQRVNEALDRFFEFGTWRGLKVNIVPVSSGGIISLDPAYQRLDALGVPALNIPVPIKSLEWAFSSAGPGPQDWTLYGELVAIDLGDSSQSVRQYQLSGAATYVDGLVFSGLARKRFTWINSMETPIVPESFSALRKGVLALGMEDEGDDDGCAKLFAEALSTLNGNLQEFDPMERQIVMQPTSGMGMWPAVH